MSSSIDRLAAFRSERERQNTRIFALQHRGINRFFRLDSAAYEDGPLPGRTKELLGLVASLVLRCDDCVTYHLDQCVAAGWSDEEIVDALNVGLIVGGSVVIPHLRRAIDTLDALRAEQKEGQTAGA